MTTNYHTPWTDSVTEYKAAHMNAPLSDLDTAIGQVSGEMWLRHSGERHYDMGITLDGQPDASAVLLRYPFPRVVDFDTDMDGSYGVVGTAPAASAEFSIKKDGVEVVTLTFASGETTGVFSGAAVQFTVGEVMTIVAPASQDANLSGIGISLNGYYF